MRALKKTLDQEIGKAKNPHSVDHATLKKLSEDIRRWERWINKNPDLFMSVHRGSDRKQLGIGARDVIQKLSLKKGERLLNAGCGSAIFLSEMVKHTPSKLLESIF